MRNQLIKIYCLSKIKNNLNECKHEYVVKLFNGKYCTKYSRKKSLPPLNSQFHCQPVHPYEYFFTIILFYL